MRAPRKKTARDPERPKKPWDPQKEDGAAFDEVGEDPGAGDYIWPECGPEDEDEL